jgi:hypothetical protein
MSEPGIMPLAWPLAVVALLALRARRSAPRAARR